MAGELIVFVVVVAAVAGIGIGIGMLVARRLDRWAATDDEETGGDDRPDA